MARSRRQRTIPVLPTALKDKADEQYTYTDIGLTGLLNVHAGQTNSARSLMWQRFNFFLAANLAIMALLANIAEMPTRAGGSMVGAYLCWIWYSMFKADRQVLIWRIELGSKFKWPKLMRDANVFVFMLRPEQLKHASRIFGYASQLIALSAGLYGAIWFHTLWPIAKPLLLRLG